jgi:hypothetical protein
VLALVALAGLAGIAPLGLLGLLTPGVLMLLPALLLAGILLAGRYPGERLIARLARSRAPRRRPVGRVQIPPRPAPASTRGGRLIAASLAGRAPPVLAAG